jgi:prevent-host-death family protein
MRVVVALPNWSFSEASNLLACGIRRAGRAELAATTNNSHTLDMSRSRATSRPHQPAVRVQVAELKARLSEYLRAAEAGQTVVVTAYGRPVVDLVPHVDRPAVRIRPATRAWGSVVLPRTGRGRTDSVSLLLEDRRTR